jgi:ATP-binding cassette subfamily C (CFTR/MRP) protein 1
MIPNNQATFAPASDNGRTGMADARGHIASTAGYAVTPVDMAQESLVGDPVESANSGQESSTGTVFTSADPDVLLSLRRSIEGDIGKDEKSELDNEKADLDFQDEKDTLSDETPSTKEEKPQQHHRLKDISEVDALLAQGKKRDRWYQLWRPKNGPPRPPESLDDVAEIPLATASIFSQLTYSWVTPLMTLGYQRPLMATDLWKMDKTREARLLSDKFMDAYTRREIEAKAYNARLLDPTDPVQPSRLQRFKWHLELTLHPRRHKISSIPIGNGIDGPKLSSKAQRMHVLEEEWRQGSGRRKASIVMSLNETMSGFWAGGLYKVLGDVAQLMCPLLTKALINFSKEGELMEKSVSTPALC